METSNLWSAISLSNIAARATANTLQWPLECCLYGWQLILQYYPVMMTYEQGFRTGSHKMLIYFTKWRRTKTQRSQGHFARISDTRETKSLNSKVRSDEKLQKAWVRSVLRCKPFQIRKMACHTTFLAHHTNRCNVVKNKEHWIKCINIKHWAHLWQPYLHNICII